MAITPKKKVSSKKTAGKTTRKTTRKKATRKKVKKSRSANKANRRFSIWKFLFKSILLFSFIAAILLGYYMWQLDKVVRAQFEGDKWTLPTHVYSRPTELFAGVNQSEKQLLSELKQLGYSEQPTLKRAGNFTLKSSDTGTTLSIHLREIITPSIKQEPRIVNILFKNNRISEIVDKTKQNISKIYLEPQIIGTLGKNREEDRKIIRIDDVPKAFITTLLITEDQDFNDHFGVSPKGIARAMISNIKQGRMAQGGSTITQQLVKNFYLTSERKLKRKVKEALMAILLEIHYSKAEILETYINEVYLGQAGNRAIHGFNLASYFYFNRPMNELTLDQFATLVGLVKGPSLYNPINKPENAVKRRNVVIGLLEEKAIINETQAETLKTQPLKIANNSSLRKNEPYPAFMDYVIQDINKNLGNGGETQTDVMNKLQGMEVYSTLDIYTQNAAEEALTETLVEIEKAKGLTEGSLQGSIVVTKIDSGEVIALTSDRNARFSGYNRAINAKRQIGSLLKPIIYLSALESGKYTLASIINDSRIQIKLPTGQTWAPNNYDRKYLGNVLLIDALAKSRNTPAVKVGIDVGLETVIDNAHKMGLVNDIPSYPSILLGSSAHSPYEVTQMYQTLANGGHRSDLHGTDYITDINDVIQWKNKPELTRVISENSSFLINYAMQEVVNRGTAASLKNTFSASKIMAGKTGTTNDLNDSWYAGYTGNILAVVWVGRDDNNSTKLTGSSGALKVWENLFERVGVSSWPQPKPARVSYLDVNKLNGAMADNNCTNIVNLPFVSGSEPAFEPCNKPFQVNNYENGRSSVSVNNQNNNQANESTYGQNNNTQRQTEEKRDEKSTNIADWLKKIF